MSPGACQPLSEAVIILKIIQDCSVLNPYCAFERRASFLCRKVAAALQLIVTVFSSA